HSTYQGNDIVFDGIALWHNGTDMSFIDLDLEDVTGVSKITTKVYNNGTVTTVTLYNDEGIVEEIQAEYRVTDVVFDVQNKVIDKLRITAAEGAALSIKLE